MAEEQGPGPGVHLRCVPFATGDRAIVMVLGEVDLTTAPQLTEAVASALGLGVKGVDVDFSGVSFCDCSGLNALLLVRHRCQERGVAFSVLGPVSPLVRRLVQVTGLADVLLSGTDHEPDGGPPGSAKG
ncbi:STAS domain-containing protein [Streptomyces sp. NBC_00882]|uniref:STAS domain-containing protein n=1 Tax=Streptomyces sp. NBC_00882 TaxID=2975856 RepID=UPI0038698154|nr:STAS domain-containing protein [Streptomyces sp. NBC_00882]